MEPPDRDSSNDQTPSSTDNKTSSNTSRSSPNRSYLLLRRGASLEDFSQLHDPTSLEAKVARGRGGGEVLPPDGSPDPNGDNNTPPETPFSIGEGKIQLETGYVMHFVPEAQTELTIYDVVSLPDAPCYPVSTATFESLPAWAQAHLDEHGHLKCTAGYDQESKHLTNVSHGWEMPRPSTADALAEIIDNADGDNLAGAVYLFLTNHASTQYDTPEAIASLRNIKPESVQAEINRLTTKIDEEVDET